MPTVLNDATLVSVAVKLVETKYKLSVFPMRHGDTIAFQTRKGRSPSPERPHQVAWVAHGLTNGMTIAIRAKYPEADKNKRLLENDYELIEVQPLKQSGLVNLRSPQEVDIWRYNVLLIDKDGNPLDSVDPDIIIKPDP